MYLFCDNFSSLSTSKSQVGSFSRTLAISGAACDSKEEAGGAFCIGGSG